MIHERFSRKLIVKNWGQIRPIHRGMLHSTLPASDSSEYVYKKHLEFCSLEPMDKTGLHLSKDTYYRLLQHSIHNKDLEEGETIYYLITSEAGNSDTFLGAHLIRMFATFGKVSDAKQVFVRVDRPSVYVWSAIISAYSMLGQSQQALHLYHAMNQAGARPDSHTFVTILQVCVNEQDLQDGMVVHSHILEYGLESADHLGSGLISLYIHLKRLDDARRVFDRLVKPTVVLWTDMINGYAQNEFFAEVLVLFEQMQLKGVQPNEVTFVCVMKACASSAAVMEGMQIHCLIIKAGVELETFVGTSLVDVYAKCGMLHDAREIFERLHKQDVVKWNAIITGEAQHGRLQEVLQLHSQMHQYGVELNQRTFTSILKVCANMRTLNPGKQVHARLIGSRTKMDVFISNALVNLYASCGDIGNACKVFKNLDKRNAVTWAVLMAGCAEHGHEKKAFCFFEQMKQEGTLPNSATFLSVLSACSNITDLKLVHYFILEDGFELDAVVASNLISRYGECKSFLDALSIFECLQEHDVVSWNAIIMASAQLSHLQKTLCLFCRMQREGQRPDSVTFNTMIPALAQRGCLAEALQLFQQMPLLDTEPDAKAFCCILEVCSKLASPQVGKLVHEQVVKRGLEVDVSVGAALINMYLMCEGMDDARRVFDRLKPRGAELWNAMLSGYMQIGLDEDLSSLTEQVQDGDLEGTPEASIMLIQEFSTNIHIEKALELYCYMNQESVIPDQITFVCILKVCSRMTTLDHGKQVHTHIAEAGLDQDLRIARRGECRWCHIFVSFFSMQPSWQGGDSSLLFSKNEDSLWR